MALYLIKIKSNIAKPLKETRAFTLMEVLIVIVVMTIILSFSLFTIKAFWETMQKRMFIHQLQADLYYAHAYAINRQEGVTFSFSKLNKRYEAIARQSNEVIIEREFPSHTSIVDSNLPRFIITSDGHISNFGTITFQCYEKKITFTFYVGRGRFKIEE